MKKIMFNDKYGLTQAVLNGRKSMTRRIEKPLDNAVEIYRDSYTDRPSFNILSQCYSERGGVVLVLQRNYYFVPTRYKVGEVVAVAQSYKDVADEDVRGHYLPRWSFIDDHCDEAGWDNKRCVKSDLMPHRIRIVDIKVERLQDISEEDAKKEGLEMVYYGNEEWYKICDTKDGIKAAPTAREAFSVLIDKTSGKGTWKRNPWVVVYGFELVNGDW